LLPGTDTKAVDGPVAPTAAAVLSAAEVIEILDKTVDWYRTLGVQQQQATEPSELLILFANRQTADKAIALAFDIARANAELLSSETDSARASAPQVLTEEQNRLAAQRQTVAAQIAGARGVKAAERAGLESELAVIDARKNLLDTMADFLNVRDTDGAGANTLKAQIDAIAATVPPAAPVVSSGLADAKGAAAPRPADAHVGLWGLASEVLGLRAKLKAIDLVDQRTAALATTFETISAKPLERLKGYSARSDALGNQLPGAAPAASQALRDEFDKLAWLFKQTAAILVPLTREQVLLGQYRHNLGSWHDATQRQLNDALGALGVRLAVLAGILAVVFLLGELWRRAVLRYSHDPRRRYQLLLIRKIVLWVVVIVIVGLSFATEISTLATFAGLLTAGLAVAMQSVLVSVVGYFFLIGKYGIRAGDRIQIGNVVGEVIDIGLVRMHLMELSTSGPLGPTGRVVAFANLVVFQTAGGLFKQIPGVNLTWHETTVKLPVVDDYAALKQRLVLAIDAVTGEYREEIARQTRAIADTAETTAQNEARPQVQMRLADGVMEALIRYPVHAPHVADIDEGVAQAILKVLAAK
jgi:small-conductance mechanosensitive channel